MRCAFAIILLLFAPWRVWAQETNAEVISEIVVECIATPLDSTSSFSLSAPVIHPYLGPAITAWAGAENKTVFAQDKPGAESLTLGSISASIEYHRAGRKEVDRTVSATLRVRLVDSEGRVRLDELCSGSQQDRIPRAVVADLQNPAWPETVAEPPPGGWRSRILQPVVITGATAVATALFFSLRSRQSDNGS